jgi:hypothetical protein
MLTKNETCTNESQKYIFFILRYLYAVNVIMASFKIQVLWDVVLCPWLGSTDVSWAPHSPETSLTFDPTHNVTCQKKIPLIEPRVSQGFLGRHVGRTSNGCARCDTE